MSIHKKRILVDFIINTQFRNFHPYNFTISPKRKRSLFYKKYLKSFYSQQYGINQWVNRGIFRNYLNLKQKL